MPTSNGLEVIAERDDLRVVFDPARGYHRLDPLPAQADIDALYHAEFYQHDKPDYLAQMERQKAWWFSLYGDWLSLIRPHTAHGERPVLLDVGAGYGYLMECADALGWKAIGVEPSPAAVTRASRFGMVHSCGWREHWDISHDRIDNADAISALWFLEHEREPGQFLEWAYSCLAPRGALLLIVPNELTAVQREASVIAAGGNWWTHPHHVNYFTQSTLANLLGRHGFRAVDWLGTYDMQAHILDGDDYTADPELGARLHLTVEELEMQSTREKRLRAYHRRGWDGACRDLICVARKE